MTKFTCLMTNSADPDQKPTDQDLYGLYRQRISGFNRTRNILISLNLSLAEHDMSCLSKQCRNRSGSALFVIKYVNFYQNPGSSNLIGWKLEMGVAS